MNYYNNQLWYKEGLKAHQMLGLTKSQIAASYAANVNNRQLADYITEAVSLSNAKSRDWALINGNEEMRGYRTFDDEIEKVHHVMREDIRQRYEHPLINTEQFAQVMFRPLVEDELDKIEFPPDVELQLG